MESRAEPCWGACPDRQPCDGELQWGLSCRASLSLVAPQLLSPFSCQMGDADGCQEAPGPPAPLAWEAERGRKTHTTVARQPQQACSLSHPENRIPGGPETREWKASLLVAATVRSPGRARTPPHGDGCFSLPPPTSGLGGLPGFLSQPFCSAPSFPSSHPSVLFSCRLVSEPAFSFGGSRPRSCLFLNRVSTTP